MKTIIIGAGAAGLMAACAAGEEGDSVILIEKNDRYGKKLSITGKGRCNVTNNCSAEELIKNIPVNGRFLYSAFSRYDAAFVMSFFENAGVSLKTERGNRVFPQSDKASDIVNALVSRMKTYDFYAIRARVTKVSADNGAFSHVVLDDGRKIFGDRVIIATGGASYPGTGSTGDGYKLAREIGHSITAISPSLVPLESKNVYCREMMGLSLKNTGFALFENGKKIYEDFGEMLFTHFGISGPMVLSASAHMKNNSSEYKAQLDLKPALDEKTLDSRILRDFAKNSKKNFGNSLDDLLPQKMIPVIISLSGISPHKTVCEITKEERRVLINLLKHFEIEISGKRPLAEAIITSGGINVSEINPSTMESKKVKNVYFAGEIIDVDAYTGGFNLQIAFATGYLAGKTY